MIFQIFLNIPGRGVLMLSRTDTDMMQPSDGILIVDRN